MIVKIQKPIGANNGTDQQKDQAIKIAGALIYDEFKRFYIRHPITPEITEILNGKNVAYADAFYDTKTQTLKINGRVSDQDW